MSEHPADYDALVARMLRLADELDAIDGHPWVLLDGVSLGGAIRYELREAGVDISRVSD